MVKLNLPLFRFWVCYRLIYWTDWGTHAKIEKAAMDGSMRQVLINDSLVWPNGIAIDFEYMRLYWADAKLDKIERSNMDGSDRTIIVDSQLPHVFGFDVAGMSCMCHTLCQEIFDCVATVYGKVRNCVCGSWSE